MDTRKKILIGAGILVLLLLGLLLVMFARSQKAQPDISAVPNNSAAQPGSQAVTPVNTVPETDPVSSDLQSLSSQLNQAALTDQDLDGLTDAEEGKQGTDPNSSDTDNDGLLDRDEIIIYKTNPLKPDTDGDGKSDGYEVRHNTNPLGAGKLVLPKPTAI